jgi:hypothetical protein
MNDIICESELPPDVSGLSDASTSLGLLYWFFHVRKVKAKGTCETLKIPSGLMTDTADITCHKDTLPPQYAPPGIQFCFE